MEGRESVILLNTYCAALFTKALFLQLFLHLKYFELKTRCIFEGI